MKYFAIASKKFIFSCLLERGIPVRSEEANINLQSLERHGRLQCAIQGLLRASDLNQEGNFPFFFRIQRNQCNL